MDELLKDNETTTLELGGKPYTMPTYINFNMLAALEDKFDASIQDLQEIMNRRRANAVRFIFYILLKENYPDMTEEDAGKLINTKTQQAITDFITKLMAG